MDLTGQRFGRLVVLERSPQPPGGRARWLCRCDCGKEIAPRACNLRSGHTSSCGCLADEHRAAAMAMGRTAGRARRRKAEPASQPRTPSTTSTTGFRDDEISSVQAFLAAGRATRITSPFPPTERLKSKWGHA